MKESFAEHDFFPGMLGVWVLVLGSVDVQTRVALIPSNSTSR